MAKEQDKFVLLFVGDHDCPLCRVSWQQFNNPSLGLRQIIDDNYVTWFESYYVRYSDPPEKSDMEHIKLYIADYDTAKAKGQSTNFPILILINPDDPDEDFTVFWGTGVRTYEELYDFISIHLFPDMDSDQELKWYDNENEVMQLAKEQGKYIFKFVGKTLNHKRLRRQLNNDPLKKALKENYVLWYSEDVMEINNEAYIKIIDPNNPDDILNEVWRFLDNEKMEILLNAYTVSNELVASDNIVTVSGKALHILNQKNNELIQVYTLTGQQIASFLKNDYSLILDASNFPKGLLIISSSSGWSTKILVR